jgi:hypothetical protein
MLRNRFPESPPVILGQHDLTLAKKEARKIVKNVLRKGRCAAECTRARSGFGVNLP